MCVPETWICALETLMCVPETWMCVPETYIYIYIFKGLTPVRLPPLKDGSCPVRVQYCTVLANHDSMIEQAHMKGVNSAVADCLDRFHFEIRSLCVIWEHCVFAHHKVRSYMNEILVFVHFLFCHGWRGPRHTVRNGCTRHSWTCSYSQCDLFQVGC